MIQGDDAIARRDQIRFDDLIDGARAFGRIAGDLVIGAGKRANRVHRTHGNNVRAVARSGDRTVAIRAQAVIPAIVPRGNHHHDSRLPSRLDGMTKWIVRVGGGYRPAQGEVEHTDVVLILQRYGLLDSGNDGAVSAGPSIAECFQAD